MKPIIVRWEVQDGYSGHSRPQETHVDVERYIMPAEEWKELSKEEKQKHLENAVEEDFSEKITIGIRSCGI